MTREFSLARPVAFPAQSGIAALYKRVHLADAFEIRLPLDASRNPDELARFIFSGQPAWIGALMKVRDMIVARLGLKTGKHLATLAGGAKSQRVGIFKVYSTSDTEIVMGEDDKHLDFRVSLLCATERASEVNVRLTLSTVVHCHNLLGRAYLLVIAPFHRLVVKASLRRAAHIGWPPG